jgi:hypothetical protein
VSVIFTTGIGIPYFYWFIWTFHNLSGYSAAYAAMPLWVMTMILDIIVFLAVGGLFSTIAYFMVHNLSTNENMNWRRYKHFVIQENSEFTNPFHRGIGTNLLEYFGLERLPGGGLGRRINWRTCFDMSTYMQFRQSLLAEKGKAKIGDYSPDGGHDDLELGN